MVTVGAIVALLGLPMAFVVGALLVAGRIHASRAAWAARQIAVTDAVHRELGAVVAPVVKRGGRGWRIEIAVPFERPAVVAQVVSTARAAALREGARDARLEVMLTPQAPHGSRASAAGPRRAPLPSPAGRREEAVAWTGATTSRAS